MSELTVSIVTPGEDMLDAQADQVTAPSVDGEVGILPGHLPLLADLKEGMVGLYKGGELKAYAVSDGFIEVQGDVVTILAETAEKASDIDVKRSERALKDAESKLKSLDGIDPEYAEQMARAQRARVRLEVGALNI